MSAESKDVWLLKGIGGGALVLLLVVGTVVVLTYSNFFAKRADLPCFKKKGQRDSFRYPDPKQIKLDQANSRIFLPKLGWLRYRNSRDVLG